MVALFFSRMILNLLVPMKLLYIIIIVSVVVSSAFAQQKLKTENVILITIECEYDRYLKSAHYTDEMIRSMWPDPK